MSEPFVTREQLLKQQMEGIINKAVQEVAQGAAEAQKQATGGTPSEIQTNGTFDSTNTWVSFACCGMPIDDVHPCAP